MRLVAATLVTLAVAGCAGTTTSGQQLHEAQELLSHYDRDLSSPAFAVLAGKIDLREAYRPDADPCAALQADRIPTAEESAALRQWAEMRESYMTRLEAVLMTEPSGTSQIKERVMQFDALEDNALHTQTVLISTLADVRLTYCQFAMLDKALTEDSLQQTGRVRGSIREERQWLFDLTHRPIGNANQIW